MLKLIKWDFEMVNTKIFSILDKNALIILQIEWLSLHACSTSQPLSGGFRNILRGLIRNINYKKYKTKNNLNI